LSNAHTYLGHGGGEGAERGEVSVDLLPSLALGLAVLRPRCFCDAVKWSRSRRKEGRRPREVGEEERAEEVPLTVGPHV